MRCKRVLVIHFTGGEAEELRRALGRRRSADKMKALETKLRAGMDANGVGPKAQEKIILAISSFALYGFPESHAASFALIAYASHRRPGESPAAARHRTRLHLSFS